MLLATFFAPLPYEIILCIYQFLPFELIALFGLADFELDNLSKWNIPRERVHPTSPSDVVPPSHITLTATPSLNGGLTALDVSHTTTDPIAHNQYSKVAPWFICHSRLFKWYLANMRKHLFDTLWHKPVIKNSSLLLFDCILIQSRVDLLNLLYTHAPEMIPKSSHLLQTLDTHFDSINHSMAFYIINHIPNVFGERARNLIDAAAKENHFRIVQYLTECGGDRKYTASNQAMNHAARLGNLEMLIYLHHNRTEGCTIDAMNYAAANGHMAMIEFLHSNRTEGASTNAIDYASRNGHLDVVGFLVLRGYRNTHKSIEYACRKGHFAIVRYLIENCCRDFNRARCIQWCIDEGHTEIFNYLRSIDPIQS